jgi:hypothetical protein
VKPYCIRDNGSLSVNIEALLRHPNTHRQVEALANMAPGFQQLSQAFELMGRHAHEALPYLQDLVATGPCDPHYVPDDIQ